ncbi:MAG: enoyl-CoA hydratase/isomerase family protein [Chloroflexi bacterium]|nr:enoyl-CoA hydratase/isomerase family protein [Chloroflexota bacterium]MCI0889306.1 enoyl-CoA hydratase/isomerase family protein [Chloroflexota bacterium]
MYEEILYEVTDPVATITLNRPDKLNALTGRTMAELRHAVADAEQRSDVVGIVITGAGRGFCAGLDMNTLQAISAGDSSAMGSGDVESSNPGDSSMGSEYQLGPFTYLLTVRKPVIAAVNGACAGLGFSLAIFSDMRFASEKAVFTTVFAHRGLVAEHGNSWMLPRLIGPGRALDVLWSGRKFDGAEALQLGIANRVTSPDTLVEEASEYIRTLAATCSPTSIMHMKQQVYRQLNQQLGEAMRETNRLQDESSRWPDLKEGVASFVERRPPKFDRVTAD